VPERICFLFAAALEHGEGVIKGGKLAKLLVPNADDRERRDDQRSFDSSGIVQRTGCGDGYQRFPCANPFP